MSFNPLEEKGISLEKQLRSWHDIVKRPFNKYDIDCYSRTRQILMNGIGISSITLLEHVLTRMFKILLHYQEESKICSKQQ